MGVDRERDLPILRNKGAIQWTHLNTFVPYCIFLKIRNTYLFKQSPCYHFEMSDPRVRPFDNNS